MSTQTYTPKFTDGAEAYGILGAEIRKVNIDKVLVSPNATDPIHVTNTDTDGRGWDDNHLFRTPMGALKSIMDRYYTKYPNEKPAGFEIGTDGFDVPMPDVAYANSETAAPETAAPETAAPETAAPETAAPVTEENPEG